MNMGFLSIESRRTLYHVISIAVLSTDDTQKPGMDGNVPHGIAMEYKQLEVLIQPR